MASPVEDGSERLAQAGVIVVPTVGRAPPDVQYPKPLIPSVALTEVVKAIMLHASMMFRNCPDFAQSPVVLAFKVVIVEVNSIPRVSVGVAAVIVMLLE